MERRERGKGLSRREALKVIGIGAAVLFGLGFFKEFGESPELTIGEELECGEAIREHQGVIGVMPDYNRRSVQQGKFPEKELQEFADLIGKQPHVLGVFADMVKYPPVWGLSEEAAKRNLILSIGWQPMDPDNVNNPDFSLGTIAKGGQDKLIKENAKEAARLGIPIYARLGFEMDGNWFSWGKNPDEFKKMWQRVVDIFRDAGATNVRWMFAPFGFADLADYYPGDNRVDVVGGDVYNKHLKSPWKLGYWRYPYILPTVQTGELMGRLKITAPGKPVCVAEMGTGEAEGRVEWLTDVTTTALGKGANLINLFWYDKMGGLFSDERDWKVTEKEHILPLSRLLNSVNFLPAGATIEEIDKAILRVN